MSLSSKKKANKRLLNNQCRDLRKPKGRKSMMVVKTMRNLLKRYSQNNN